MNAFKPTTALNLPTISPTSTEISQLCLKIPLPRWALPTNPFVPIPLITTSRSYSVTAKAKNTITTSAIFTLSPLCVRSTGFLSDRCFLPSLSNMLDKHTKNTIFFINSDMGSSLNMACFLVSIFHNRGIV